MPYNFSEPCSHCGAAALGTWCDCQECSQCGWVGDGDYMSYCECNDDYWCDDCGHCSRCCYDCSYHEDRPVKSWDYRPDFMPKGNPGEPMFGVELEVGGYEDYIVPVVQDIDPYEDHLYMKEDGSISGVEIVTHPMTLEFARTYPFGQMLRGLRDARCNVDRGYGLHVHVDRKAFDTKPRPKTHAHNRLEPRQRQQSQMHQMMWLLFLSRNTEGLVKLARRESSRWAPFTKPVAGELKRKAQGMPYRESRYQAVNCTNRHTFELRFFQATLDEQEFMAAIEFADASVRYARQVTSKDVLRPTGQKALTWHHFTQWVLAHDYPQLTAELTK